MKNYLLAVLGFICSFCNSEIKEEVSSSVPSVNTLASYEPEMVGPGIISQSSFEGHASITPDGNELYFAIYSNDHAYSTIAYSKRVNNSWHTPQIASFSGNFSDGSPALSPDGKRLYFSSSRPIGNKNEKSSTDIWYVERKGTANWSNPIKLGEEVNSEYVEFSPSVDHSYNLYFCSKRPNGLGDMDIYYAEFKNGKYEQAYMLNYAINSEHREGNVGVSPNGNMLFVMVQHKPGDYGYDDIHYSIRKNKEWAPLKNLGSIVNTPTYDFSPKISPDGTTMYFSSRINEGFISQQEKYTYNSFQKRLNSPLNGLGNIYKISLSKLNLDLDE